MAMSRRIFGDVGVHAKAVLAAIRAVVDLNGDLFIFSVRDVLLDQCADLVGLRVLGNALDMVLAHISPLMGVVVVSETLAADRLGYTFMPERAPFYKASRPPPCLPLKCMEKRKRTT